MTINLTDPASQPANGPLTAERITRLIAELQRSLEYQNGGDMAYVIADAIKGLEELLVSREAVPVYQVMYGESWRDITEEQYHDHAIHESPIRIVYTAPPPPEVPETLPCPVLLEPGLRFGKGVKTQLLFGALKRRAEYYAELDAMTPEQRAEHDAGVAEFKAMLAGNSPVTQDGWIPVSERMPGRSGVYMVWNGKHIGAVSLFFGSFQCIKPEQITHWRHMPAAPQEEKTERKK